MEEFLILSVKFLFQAFWFGLMAFCGAFAALYLMRVNKFNVVQNWIMAVGGAITVGPLIVWIMDLTIYYIFMHFMGAIMTLWIYKFITHDFAPQDPKVDIADVYDAQSKQDDRADKGE